MDVWRGIKSMYNYTSIKKRMKKIRLGICAMDKKAKSKPMREILSRLPEELFEVVIFGDEVILNQPPEAWPVVEVLIAFYSSKYPTDKALQYVKLRKPFMINDLEMETTLKDRRKVYSMLQANGIDVPVHVICNRDDPTAESLPVLEEFDEYILVNGVQINKPLVEKPVDAEDHNIYIYYPMSAGGGSKRLFRKVDDRSSEFYPRVHELRKEGSYIYEEFVVTQGTDVKVYTVGADYGHAEARKSPVVDGRVNRDHAGLEVRYPVILSHHEKDMARKIVLAFKQTVCGFDILRVHGKSFCCDVNGFSFVKNSRKYYDDASQVLTEMMIAKCRPDYLAHPSTKRAQQGPMLTKEALRLNSPRPVRATTPAVPAPGRSTSSSPAPKRDRDKDATPRDPDLSSQCGSVHGSLRGGAGGAGGGGGGGEGGSGASEYLTGGDPYDPDNVTRRGSHDNLNERSSADEDGEELRCVIAIIRHGDRTPKQKMKVKVSHSKFLDYFHQYAKTPRKDLKVKSRSALVRFLEVTREIISDGTVTLDNDPDLYRKLRQIRDVLERWEISGINRKLQMKPQKWSDNWNGDVEEEKASKSPSLGDVSPMFAPHDPPNAQIGTFKPPEPPSSTCSSPTTGTATEVLLILKWGGDLTPLGREQAEHMGARFRHEMYPDNAGGGVLRLHATYRHDLKIKASDEGRVMKTAAAFTKGLLELEGQLTPILASLVTVEEKNRQMLDRGGNALIKEDMDRCKDRLNLLQVDRAMDEELVDQIAAGCPKAVRAALLSLSNPLGALRRLHSLIGELCAQLQRIVELQELEYFTELELESAAKGSAAVGVVGQGGVQGTDAAKPSSVDGSGGGGGGGGGGSGGSGGAGGGHCRISSAASLPDGNSAANPANEPQAFPHSQVGEPDHPPGPVDSKLSAGSGSKGSLGSTASPRSHVDDNKLYLSETFSLMLDRWEKLNKDLFSPKTNMFDLSKVPDVYDMIRYDALHNSHLDLVGMRELYETAAALENSIVPQEYGMDGKEKRVIGSKVCGALLEKIRYDVTMARGGRQDDVGFMLDHGHAEDLEINSLSRAVRTRLYFTSESHLHTLINALRYPAPGDPCAIDPEGLEKLDNVSELSYLTQIVIRLFEHRDDPNISRCEISLSPGATNNPFTDKSSSLAEYICLSKDLNQEQLLQCLSNSIFASTQDSTGNSVHGGSPREDESNDGSPARNSRDNDHGDDVDDPEGKRHLSLDNDTVDSVDSGIGISRFDDSPAKAPQRNTLADRLRKPIPIRRTNSVTVVSDNVMADPWKTGWAGGQG